MRIGSYHGIDFRCFCPSPRTFPFRLIIHILDTHTNFNMCSNLLLDTHLSLIARKISHCRQICDWVLVYAEIKSFSYHIFFTVLRHVWIKISQTNNEKTNLVKIKYTFPLLYIPIKPSVFYTKKIFKILNLL